MRKLIFCSVLFFAVFSYADNDCPPAADAAEAQNQEKFKHCDYSNEGLNGVLHRALQNSSDKKDTKTTQEKSDSKLDISPAAEKDFLLGSEFSSAQQLQNLRFALIQKAIAECPKGFVLDAERYLPSRAKSIKLELVYHCL